MGKKARNKPIKPFPIPKFDKLYIRDAGRCWICGEHSPSIMFNRDHLIPKSLGGSDGMWNLRISHPMCNTKRDRMPPPLDLVLQYCVTPDSVQRAKRMYYRAYPHLKEGYIPPEDTDKPVIVKGVKVGKLTPYAKTIAPEGHKRHHSAVCSLCLSWCGTCKTCWCMAFENDHDVLKIRGTKVEMGIASPS